jgi:hypothetical protein
LREDKSLMSPTLNVIGSARFSDTSSTPVGSTILTIDCVVVAYSYLNRLLD